MGTCEATSIKKETFDSVLMHDETPLIKEEHPIHTADLVSFKKKSIDPLLMHDDSILIKEEMDTYNTKENNFDNVMQIELIEDSMTPSEDMLKMENCDLANTNREAVDPILIKEKLSTHISEGNNFNRGSITPSDTVSEMEDYEVPSIKKETHDSISIDDEKLIIKEEFDTHASGGRNLNDNTQQNSISPSEHTYVTDYVNYNHKLTSATIIFREAKRSCAFVVKQNLFHIKSADPHGVHLEFNLKHIPEGIKLDHYITFKLKRTDPKYEHLPVDIICEKHKYGFIQFPVEGRACTTHNKEKTNMIKFKGNNENMKAIISKEAIEKGEINICMRILFACNDSCASSSTPFKSREKARDMAIFAEVGVIYSPEHTEIIHSFPPVPVWLKAALVERDLIKDVRRKPKGYLVSQGSKNISKTQLRTKLIPGASRKESADLVVKYLQQEQPSLEVLKELTNVLEKYYKN